MKLYARYVCLMLYTQTSCLSIETFVSVSNISNELLLSLLLYRSVVFCICQRGQSNSFALCECIKSYYRPAMPLKAAFERINKSIILINFRPNNTVNVSTSLPLFSAFSLYSLHSNVLAIRLTNNDDHDLIAFSWLYSLYYYCIWFKQRRLQHIIVSKHTDVPPESDNISVRKNNNWIIYSCIKLNSQTATVQLLNVFDSFNFPNKVI